MRFFLIITMLLMPKVSHAAGETSEPASLKPIPDKLVVLTFDDSSRTHFTVARPILNQYGFGATFFITEGFDFKTKKKDYMTWEQIAQLHKDGFEIGNHTRDHLGITDETVDQLKEQLEGIAAKCKEHGIPQPVTFAWPGNATSVKAFDILKGHGIQFARRGGAPEYPYKEGRGFAFEPGKDHPLLLPSAGDARPDWDLGDLIRAVEQAREGRVAILQFHGVPDTAHAWVNTQQRKFEAYMKYLDLHDYKVISLGELAEYVNPEVRPDDFRTVIEVRQELVRAEAAANSPLAKWRDDVSVKPALTDRMSHSIHSYFNTCPESPNGEWELFYRSTDADGHFGEVVIHHRETEELRIIAEEVEVEDAHRAACQQWIDHGKSVVYHNLRDGVWEVIAVEIKSGQKLVLAKNRQVGWGQPKGKVVPLYGPHWNPGEHRHLELLDVETGKTAVVVTIDEVEKAWVNSEHAEWYDETFDGAKVSIFFPILSPDGNRVFFKMATPAGGDFRSTKASKRYGIVAWDLKEKRALFLSPRWGHPAWHPDSRHLINIWNQRVVLIDIETGRVRNNQQLPKFPGGHPFISPDGQLFVTDHRIGSAMDGRQLWGVTVGDFETSEHRLIDRFENSEGAKSWRKSHPHPVFSADGRRIYFNVSEGAWTRLFVAEALRKKPNSEESPKNTAP